VAARSDQTLEELREQLEAAGVVVSRTAVHRYTGQVVVPASTNQGFNSVWRASYGSIVTAIVRLTDGRSVGAYTATGGIG
jgi:amidase